MIILIYIFFPGRFLEEVEFTFNDEVHEINALIEDVIDLRRELKNIFNDWHEVLSRPLIFLPPYTNGLQLRHGLSFFRRRKQLTTKLVSLCMGSSLNDEANDYKLNRDNAKIYIYFFFLAGPWKKSSLHITTRCMKLMLLLKRSIILEEN